MKLFNFRKSKDLPDPQGDSESAELDEAACPEIELVGDRGDLAVEGEELACIPLPSAHHNAPTLLDALVPIAAAGADARNQYCMAVVKFPKGKGWGDLCVRKSDGWNLLSSLGKDKKFDSMAAIKKAGLTGPAVANLALQGAAVVVGQAYMAEISGKLDGIQEGISKIQAEMEMERSAKLEGTFETLKRYALRYDEYASDPGKLQAARGELESILRESNAAWSFQMKAMRAAGQEIEKAKRPNEEEARHMVLRLSEAESNAAAVFQLMSCAQQTSMQFDEDFSTKRIERERAELQGRVEEYGALRGDAYGALFKKIGEMKGKVLAVGQVQDDGYKTINPVIDAGHFAVQQAARVTPLALVGEAKDQTASKRNELRNAATEAEDRVKALATVQEQGLETMNLMYNEADSFAVEKGKIKFFKSNDQGALSATRPTERGDD